MLALASLHLFPLSFLLVLRYISLLLGISGIVDRELDITMITLLKLWILLSNFKDCLLLSFTDHSYSQINLMPLSLLLSFVKVGLSSLHSRDNSSPLLRHDAARSPLSDLMTTEDFPLWLELK